MPENEAREGWSKTPHGWVHDDSGYGAVIEGDEGKWVVVDDQGHAHPGACSMADGRAMRFDALDAAQECIDDLWGVEAAKRRSRVYLSRAQARRQARGMLRSQGSVASRLELRLREVVALERLAGAQVRLAAATERMADVAELPDDDGEFYAPYKHGGRWVRDDGWVVEPVGEGRWGVILSDGSNRWLNRQGGVEDWHTPEEAREYVDHTIAALTDAGDVAVGWRWEPAS